MFDFFLSEEKKTRGHASNWLEVADRVYKFRRDLLTEAQQKKLLGAAAELRARLQERAPVAKLKAAIAALETALRETGGRHYPVSSLVENVEFFLVAAIVILGLRAYFVQPFKIPTNSMWPTYYGMKGESFAKADEPGVLAKAGRLVAYGAVHHTVYAPADGEVMVPVLENSFYVPFSLAPGRSLFIFPSTVWQYTLSVGGEMVHVDVPVDFGDFDEMLNREYGSGPDGWRAGLEERLQASGQPQESMLNVAGTMRRVFWVPLGRKVHKGDRLLSFDVMTGDLLFVDRISYNFFPPKVGQGFVFKTENIHSEHMKRGGVPIKSYYIKRLVGTPGDTLEVRPPVLFRNGKPADGSPAFQKNATREGLYPGYAFAHRQDGSETLTGPGETVTVPSDGFYAMGDNSPQSEDSRYWGFVPNKDVVGRPLFIYYPISRRWGPAR